MAVFVAEGEEVASVNMVILLLSVVDTTRYKWLLIYSESSVNIV